MVSTRRKAATTAADEAPQPAPRRTASPRRPRRAAASEPAVDTAGPSEDDAKWAAHYRDLVRREKEAAGRNAFTRAVSAVRRAWHHYRIALGPFMLDPWEQALYLGGILLLFFAAFHALQRLVDMAAPALAAFTAAIKPLLNSS